MDPIDFQIRELVDDLVSRTPDGPPFEHIASRQRTLAADTQHRAVALPLAAALIVLLAAVLVVRAPQSERVTLGTTDELGGPSTDPVTGALPSGPSRSVPDGAVLVPHARASTVSQTVEIRKECWMIGEHGRCSSGGEEVVLATPSGQNVTLVFDRQEQPISVRATLTSTQASRAITLEATNPTLLGLDIVPGLYDVEIDAQWGSAGTSTHSFRLSVS